ncbi:MAG: SH3 domain-containing protein [Alcanivoracaceae bacterium]|nr:SH3 domain-containing protein [Alcanivoracaceae bacterium]
MNSRIAGQWRWVIFLGLLFPALAFAEKISVQVADPYLDVRSGPGRGYPVFHVVDQGDWIEVIKRRTQWIKVRTPRGQTGWVFRQQLSRTLDGTGDYVALEEIDQSEFYRAHGEFGVAIGEIDGITSLTISAGYSFTENLQADLLFSEATGSRSSTRLLSLGLQHHMFPRWRYSPYVLVGAGDIEVTPRTVLVSPEVESNRQVHAGVGVRAYLTRTFVFRAEYRTYVVLTDSNDNDELEAWRTGFSVLF